MKVLGIETSCDETAAAVVCDDKNPEKRIISNVIASQIDIHKKYGGVVPNIAARCHVDVIDKVVKEALENANCSIHDIDVIAATACPGLIGGLIVGTVFAKTMSIMAQKPYIAIDHLEGHLLTCRMCYDIDFPFLGIITSGGNFMFIEALDVGKYNVLGQTLDDAAGECFDKVSKMLGLGYPGGKVIQEKAKLGDENRFQFTIPMQHRAGCDVSFSGLKTAVKTCIASLGKLSEQDICDVAASFQNTVVTFVIKQLGKAYKKLSIIPKGLVVCGGVAANLKLRNALKIYATSHSTELFTAPLDLCGDNGAMIAWTAIERINHNFPFSGLDYAPSPRSSIFV